MLQSSKIFVIFIILVEYTTSSRPSIKKSQFPLLKSLGVPKSKQTKSLEDTRVGQEYVEQYQEMMKASPESFETFDDHDNRRLRRVIGDDDLLLMAEAGGYPYRRRSASMIQSVMGQRRARSQAVRKNKLNNQALKSHLMHSKYNNHKEDVSTD